MIAFKTLFFSMIFSPVVYLKVGAGTHPRTLYSSIVIAQQHERNVVAI
jgi:hypothetical protein